MCKPRDIDYIAWTLVSVWVGILGLGVYQEVKRADSPAAKALGCNRVAKDFEAGALAAGRTVYHFSGCPGDREYWIIEIEPTKGETNGPSKDRVRTHARRQGGAG